MFLSLLSREVSLLRLSAFAAMALALFLSPLALHAQDAPPASDNPDFTVNNSQETIYKIIEQFPALSYSEAEQVYYRAQYEEVDPLDTSITTAYVSDFVKEAGKDSSSGQLYIDNTAFISAEPGFYRAVFSVHNRDLAASGIKYRLSLLDPVKKTFNSSNFL